MIHLDSTTTILDPCGGRGIFLIELIKYARSNGLDLDTKNLYYNDINPAMTAFFRKINKAYKYGIPNENITCADALTRNWTMKFDTIVSNPPYNSGGKDDRVGSRGETSLWPKFVLKSLDLLKDNGQMVMIHPPAWRKPDDRHGFWKLLTQDNQMEHLVMSSGKGNDDWFGIKIRADYYIVKKTPATTTTLVRDHEGVERTIDLTKLPWLPNYAIDEITQLLGNGTEVLYNTYYHTQKKHSDIPTAEFRYPVVHTINKSGLGIKYFDSLPPNDTTHNQPKVLLNQNELQYPYNDYKGEYGMSQLTFGIPIKDQAQGDAIVAFINSEKGKRLISATKWNTYYTDYSMFNSFKHDFYK